MKNKSLILGMIFSLFLVGCNDSATTNSSNSANSSTSNITNQTENSLNTLYVLSINDLHGNLMRDTKGRNGMSSLSYMIDDIRDKQKDLDDVVLVANGDMFQGQAISNLVFGASVINVMNAMDFDMMGIGNHEFDWGIEKILSYWDGNETNGEANFPLVNSNVYNSRNELIDHTVPYTIVQKENLKIGICSAIDPSQKSSILKTKSDGYDFRNTVLSIGNTAEILRKQEQCDLVIANIHDGVASSNSVNSENNAAIAKLSGDKKVDVLINGHTHYRNSGLIARNNDVSLPVVQAGSSASSLGIITLNLNDNKEVIRASAKWKYTDTNYDSEIENLVNQEYEKIQDQVEEVYGIGGENVSQEKDLYSWAASCMQKATDADIAISNNGGIRGTGNIKTNQEITINNLYDINPFDNEILLTTKTGQQIKSFLNSTGSSNYYRTKDDATYSTFDDNTNYQVAIIDYVGFKNNFSIGNYTNTHLIFRDLMKDDIKERKKQGKTFKPITESASYLTYCVPSV